MPKIHRFADLSLTRRGFLHGAAAGLAVALVPGGARRSHAAGAGQRVLVSVFLRGGADGLSLVVPHGDPDYYTLRPTIAVPPGDEIDIDGFFGLHPAMAPLDPLFRSGALAVVHAVGDPHPTRSHFDAQDAMDRASPGNRGVYDGWLNRLLAALRAEHALAGVTIGVNQSESLRGAVSTVALENAGDLAIDGDYAKLQRARLRRAYRVTAGIYQPAIEAVLDSDKVLGGIEVGSDVVYPRSRFARRMQQTAALIKADVGVCAVAVDRSGWDTHRSQNELLPRSANDLAASLAAFYEDLGSAQDRTLVLVMTEFGRAAFENGSGGSDHGRASAMFALGGGIAGGRVLLGWNIWPGLSQDRLFEGRDLTPSLDYRSVFAEVLDRHMGITDFSSVLPGFETSSALYPGLYV